MPNQMNVMMIRGKKEICTTIGKNVMHRPMKMPNIQGLIFEALRTKERSKPESSGGEDGVYILLCQDKNYDQGYPEQIVNWQGMRMCLCPQSRIILVEVLEQLLAPSHSSTLAAINLGDSVETKHNNPGAADFPVRLLCYKDLDNR
jgi:hypothetical protein